MRNKWPAPTLTDTFYNPLNAILNSGTYDWVLAEITQEGEFSTTRIENVPGFEDLKKNDLAIHRQVLEDRASLIFWKYVETSARNNLDSFARLCDVAELKKLRRSVFERNDSNFEKVALGSVDLRKIYSENGSDFAVFELRWSDTGAGTNIVYHSILQLKRDQAVKTNSSFGLSTDRCHACGSIQIAAEATHCQHCDSLLTQDWVFYGMTRGRYLRGPHRP